MGTSVVGHGEESMEALVDRSRGLETFLNLRPGRYLRIKRGDRFCLLVFFSFSLSTLLHIYRLTSLRQFQKDKIENTKYQKGRGQ